MTHEVGGRENKARAARRCREALSKQLGVITRAQAMSAGLSSGQIDSRLANGTWVALFPGVYADSTSSSTWRRSVLAAVYRGGPDAVASGKCAAALLGLPGFRPGRIEITTPRQLTNPPFNIRRGHVPREQRTRVGPIAVTDASRTLLDVAAFVEQPTLEDAVDDAVTRSLTSLPRLRWILRTTGGRGRKGSGALWKIVEDRVLGGPVPESVLETRLWKPLCGLGVPRPIRQFEVSWDGRSYRIDFAFPHAMVAVEAHGFRWHSSASALERDAEKHNALALLGWRVIYVTWRDMKEGRDEMMTLLKDMMLPRLL